MLQGGGVSGVWSKTILLQKKILDPSLSHIVLATASLHEGKIKQHFVLIMIFKKKIVHSVIKFSSSSGGVQMHLIYLHYMPYRTPRYTYIYELCINYIKSIGGAGVSKLLKFSDMGGWG